jgi:hypothetical protein
VRIVGEMRVEGTELEHEAQKWKYLLLREYKTQHILSE